MNKTVVTMTSWKKRIDCVGKAIYSFMKNQIEKPDYFYLWLSKEEFENCESDLPEELLLVSKVFNVKIKWTEKNEYCFKRWHVYPDHMQDYVISIDDDTIYKNNIIKDCKKLESGIIYNLVEPKHKHVYDNDIQKNIIDLDSDASFLRLFCGQCIIPPNTFPIECLENEKKRFFLSPRCDESWFTPILLKHKIKIAYFGGKDIIIKKSEIDALWKQYIKKTEFDCRKKDLLLYCVLRGTNSLDEWKKVFPKYNDYEYKKYDVIDLLTYIL